jgi:hypothetical protein
MNNLEQGLKKYLGYTRGVEIVEGACFGAPKHTNWRRTRQQENIC